MVLRRAVHADLPGLLSLEHAAFSDPWSDDGLRAELEVPHARVWVWVDPEPAAPANLAAALLGWQIFEDFHVNRVAVLPGRRREGLGRKLMQHALQVAQSEGATAALLEVRADNAPALALYETMGFQREGRRKSYYPDGTDAILMRKPLI